MDCIVESSLCFLFRFSAAWEYILNLSKEEYSEKMILQILEIINKIATVVPMSLTASAMVQGFQQSVLFGSVLPGFINEVTGRPSHVRYFLKLRSTFDINLLKFLSFNIPMKRDSILDPSAYGFGNALAIRHRRALGSRLKAQWVFLHRTPKH